MSAIPLTELPLAPLGAGDLIDRAVRLYRRHFMTLIRIAAPPVIVSAAGSMLTTISFRALFATSSGVLLALYGLMLAAGFVLTLCGSLFSLMVMGGASRNLVTHLLWNQPVSVRATYRAIKERFWGLLVAAVVVAMWLGLVVAISFWGWFFLLELVMLGAVAFTLISPWLGGFAGIAGSIAVTIPALWFFFFLAGRVAYVPQAMLVEGKKVSAALGRSFSLARGNVRRLMAMTLFTFFATYSALMILVIPLGWVGYLNGIEPSPFAQFDWPAWYAIGYNVVWQCSHILLAPIWMLGLSLLYVDERVRQEGYDIELMAARQLGEAPSGVRSPFAPALVTGISEPTPPPPPPPASPMPTGSVLGLG